MIEEQEKYIDCNVCGASILEQCAIEEDGQFLCGDCIINETKKEVDVAEEVAKKKREEEYEIERQKLVLKKKKHGLIILLTLILVLSLSVLIMKNNKPKPVNSIIIDYSKDLYAAKSLITIGIYKFTEEKEQLPKSLSDLDPEYIPKGLDDVFNSFSYVKLSNEFYELEIVQTSSLTQTGENDEE